MQNNEESYFLGIDLGTSFIKVSLINETQQCIETIKTPQKQMKIISLQQNYCQQDPEQWWKHTCQATKKLFQKYPYIRQKKLLKGIGISYQMHGLILVDENLKTLRNSIIWSDGRTQQIGKKLTQQVIANNLDKLLLNSPGNFTLSKLIWVKQNQPQIFSQVYKFLLPGDFIAMKLSNKCLISQTGLSQCALWDFKKNVLCSEVLKLSQISEQIVPEIVGNFSDQGQVTKECQNQSGIPQGTKILYRSGDQPNNAYSLNVKQPGQASASGGTSGTVLVVSQKPESTQMIRINTFLHNNHSLTNSRYAKLLCINSSGIIYSWLKNNLAIGMQYQTMNKIAEQTKSQGIVIIPFGNGLERMLNFANVKVSIKNLDLNRHSLHNIIRATVQSIGFSFIYGMKILKNSEDPSLEIKSIKIANDNLFNCKVITDIISAIMQCDLNIVSTTGSVGCAKGAKECYQKLQNSKETYEKDIDNASKLQDKSIIKTIYKSQYSEVYQQQLRMLYQKWEIQLEKQLKTKN